MKGSKGLYQYISERHAEATWGSSTTLFLHHCLFSRHVILYLDTSSSSRISFTTWELVSDVSSLSNNTKEVMGEVDHIPINIRKQNFHSLNGYYFQGSIGFEPNASINTLSSWSRRKAGNESSWVKLASARLDKKLFSLKLDSSLTQTSFKLKL